MAENRAECLTTPPCASDRMRTPTAELATRSSSRRPMTHSLLGSASSIPIGRLELPVYLARDAAVALAITSISPPISGFSTLSKSQVLPVVAGAVSHRCGRHSSAPPMMAATIQPRNRRPSSGDAQRYRMTARAMSPTLSSARRASEVQRRAGQPDVARLGVQVHLAPFQQQPVAEDGRLPCRQGGGRRRAP